MIKITAKLIKVIEKNPEAFNQTEIESVRESAMGHFSLYYKITEDHIIIISFWDNRQNPVILLKHINGLI